MKTSAVILFLGCLFLIPCYTLRAQLPWKEGCCALQLKTVYSLTDLIQEHERLKKLSTKSGNCCSHFRSGLMEVMYELVDSIPLGSPGKRVKQLLGQPDIIQKTLPHELVFFKERINAASGKLRTIYIYNWRDGHDYYFFIIDKGKVVFKNWYHAGE